MKNNATLTIDFLAGTSLDDALAEAKDKAIKFEFCYVCFNFNGVSFSVSPRADLQRMSEEYSKMGRKYGVTG